MMPLRPARLPNFIHIKKGRILETGEIASIDRIYDLTDFTNGFFIDISANQPKLVYALHASDGSLTRLYVIWNPPLTRLQEESLDVILRNEIWRQNVDIPEEGISEISHKALEKIRRLVGNRRLEYFFTQIQAWEGGSQSINSMVCSREENEVKETIPPSFSCA